jgi:hypothetical protein
MRVARSRQEGLENRSDGTRASEGDKRRKRRNEEGGLKVLRSALINGLECEPFQTYDKCIGDGGRLKLANAPAISAFAAMMNLDNSRSDAAERQSENRYSGPLGG